MQTYLVRTEGPRGPRNGRGLRQAFIVLAEHARTAELLVLAHEPAGSVAYEITLCDKAVTRISVS